MYDLLFRYLMDIAWVKRTVNRKLAKCHGYYLQHAKETCLVGIKVSNHNTPHHLKSNACTCINHYRAKSIRTF